MLKHLKSSEDWSEKSLGAKGFTLIELLVVIVILGVLAAVVVFSVSGITDNSEQSGCAQELRTIETAVEAYRAQEGAYPANIGALAPGFIRSTSNLLGSYTVSGSTVTVNSCPTP
ncbi:MAG: prepilin-type N-terminal cleavage/methylation domain-containing protein [Acidimicrobiales bacterium]